MTGAADRELDDKAARLDRGRAILLFLDSYFSEACRLAGHKGGEVPAHHMSLVEILFITYLTDGRQFHQRMNALDVKGIVRDVERRMDPDGSFSLFLPQWAIEKAAARQIVAALMRKVPPPGSL